MKDLENRADLELLMATFYGRLLADPAINYIFTDVAKIDLPSHLPQITDFWEQVLFHTGGYKANVMQLHIELNSKEKLTKTHFESWLSHFFKAVDDLFKGNNSEIIKTRAQSVATVMEIKLYSK
ncbi:group III truncated hemoglobin [Flavobacterium zepuense]|uniref:Group III truncated hemoglobin n=1 Tax=Flavobacterium zepuense TaxID=2593302 RepID=A0A552V4E5_9FLAO|nr:group III truncated hemoglobin [Flavobacterium zepuense]TRW25309.1 group III truncated hemoglobin [Flavobacterium zepuense]